MIKELVPVEETRAGRELIEKGYKIGYEIGYDIGHECYLMCVEIGKAQATLEFVHRLRGQGLSRPEISKLTGLFLQSVEAVVS